jgi:hypothetical protein
MKEHQQPQQNTPPEPGTNPLWDLFTGQALLPPEPMVDLEQQQRNMVARKQMQDRNAEVVRARDEGRKKRDELEKQREKALEQQDRDRANYNKEQWIASFIKQWTSVGNDLDSLTQKVIDEAYLQEQKSRMMQAQQRIARRYGEMF